MSELVLRNKPNITKGLIFVNYRIFTYFKFESFVISLDKGRKKG